MRKSSWSHQNVHSYDELNECEDEISGVDFVEIFRKLVPLPMAFYITWPRMLYRVTSFVQYITMSSCCNQKLNKVGRPISRSHAKNRIQIGHFSYFFWPFFWNISTNFEQRFHQRQGLWENISRILSPRPCRWWNLKKSFSSFFQDRPKNIKNGLIG